MSNRTLPSMGLRPSPSISNVRNPSHAHTWAMARAKLVLPLSGKIPWQERIGRDERTGLYYFAAAGSGAGFPARLEQQLDGGPIEQMKAAFDYIILDSPPVMRVADATVFARFADILVLVVAAKRTRRRMVAEAPRRLSMAAKPVGLVLANTKTQPTDEDIYAGYWSSARERWAATH